MDIFKLRVFQQQVYLQCQFIMQSAQLLSDTDQTWFALQSLLNAAGNVSKALWGQGGKFSDQRRPLRESIGVDDSSPLKIVGMRNDWEHFDERIDEWWEVSENHNYIDRNIGIGDVGAKPIDTFRNWNPGRQELVFWGKAVNIRAIIEEVERIMPKLKIETSKPHWEE